MTEQERKYAEKAGLIYSENKESDTPMIPQHQAETTFMHLSWANRRMLIALVCVCVTFIITILTFVIGYTIREKNWLNTITGMQQKKVAVTEVTDESAGSFQ